MTFFKNKYAPQLFGLLLIVGPYIVRLSHVYILYAPLLYSYHDIVNREKGFLKYDIYSLHKIFYYFFKLVWHLPVALHDYHSFKLKWNHCGDHPFTTGFTLRLILKLLRWAFRWSKINVVQYFHHVRVNVLGYTYVAKKK